MNHRDTTAATVLVSLYHVKGRKPTEKERKSGVPFDFTIEERPGKKNPERVDKYYFSSSGKQYRSISEIKRNYISLNIQLNNQNMGVFPFFPSTFVTDIVNSIQSGTFLFYKGIARSPGVRLEDFLQPGKTATVRLLEKSKFKQHNIITIKL